MKRLISIVLCITILFTSINLVLADENTEENYSTVSVEFSDNIGELETLQVMVKEKNVYVNAEELGTRLGYDVSISSEYVSIYSKGADENVPYGMTVFYYGSTRVGHMLFTKMVNSYEAPFETIRNENGVWIPLEYSLLLLNGSMLIIGNTIRIDVPSKNIIDIYTDILKNNQIYLFDWQNDIGVLEENEITMGVASFYVNLFNGLLNKDGASWVQFLQSFALNTSSYDAKYGEELAMLFCTYSASELKQETKKMKKLMSHFNGKGALGKAINAIEKDQDKNIKDLLKESNKLKAEIDVNNNASVIAYNKAYQALENVCDQADAFSKKTALYKQVGKGVSEATCLLDKFYKVIEVVGFAGEFQQQDKFALHTLSEYVDNSNSQSNMSEAMKESIAQYTDILQTDIATYSALRWLEENYDDKIFEALELGDALGLPAELLLIGWDVMSGNIPFLKEGLSNTDSFMLSIYASIFQADAFTSYQAIRNSIFNDADNITPENLYKVSQYCYTYLKSCYITRNAALGALNEEIKSQVPGLIEYQNSVNEEIAGYLIQLKNVDTTNQSKCYGFLPEDNKEYLKNYDNRILEELVNKGNDAIEITEYKGNFEKIVEMMDMARDNEAMRGSNNYYNDDFKLGWDENGHYEASNEGNEKIILYGIYIGEDKKDVLTQIQKFEYICPYSTDESDSFYLLDNGELIYVEILYDNEQVSYWYTANFVEGDITEIEEALKIKEQYNAKDSESWKLAYIDFIFQEGINYDYSLNRSLEEYKLVNVNGDDIPELYINFGSIAQGDMLCSYFNNSIIYQYMYNYGFSYIEGKNLFMDSGGHMDAYHDIIYSIEDGKFTEQYKGEYGAEDNSNVQFDSEGYPIYNYYWNGNRVSNESEYEELLNQAFDKEKAKYPYENDGVYDYRDIIKQIIEY